MPVLVRIKENLSHRTLKGVITGDTLYIANDDEIRSFGDKFDVVPITPSFIGDQRAATVIEWVEAGALDPQETMHAEAGLKNRKTVIEACKAKTVEQRQESLV